jgi:hypothetical protein
MRHPSARRLPLQPLWEGAGMRLVLVIEQIDGGLPTANVELIKDGDGVIATATASAFDDPVFQLQEAARAIRDSYQRT